MSRKIRKTTEATEEQVKEEALKEQLRILQYGIEPDLVSDLAWSARKKLLQIFPTHKERMVVMNHIVQEQEKEMGEMKVDLGEHTNFLEKKEEEKKVADEEFERARRKQEKANSVLYAARRYHANLEDQIKKREKDLKGEKDCLEQMEEIVLVHSTASLKQIKKHQLGIIFITKSEEDLLGELLPDEVVEFDLDSNFVEHLPRDFEKKYDEKTRKGIIEYCNLVINAKLAGDEIGGEEFSSKIIPLYSNVDIAEILRINGLDF